MQKASVFLSPRSAVRAAQRAKLQRYKVRPVITRDYDRTGAAGFIVLILDKLGNVQGRLANA